MSGIQDQLIDIARRKERLIARAEAQRVALAGSIRELRGPIGVADRALEAARFLRAHPLLVGIGLAAVVAFRRRGLLSLASSGLAAWRVWRLLSAWPAALHR